MDQLVTIQLNQTITTSQLVAKAFGKRHDHVLRDIESLGCSREFFAPNFGEILIDRHLGMGRVRKDKAYTITKDGFTFLAMGYNGPKAAQFKEAYINAFNEMDAQIKRNNTSVDASLNITQNSRICALEQSVKDLTEKLTEAGLFKYLEGQKAIEPMTRMTVEAPKPFPVKLYTVSEYASKIGVKVPSRDISQVSIKALSHTCEKGLSHDRPENLNRYTEEALRAAFEWFKKNQDKKCSVAIEYLKGNQTAQDLKLLEKGEYIVFHASNKEVTNVVTLINKWTHFIFKLEYRRTLNPSYKVTRIK